MCKKYHIKKHRPCDATINKKGNFQGRMKCQNLRVATYLIHFEDFTLKGFSLYKTCFKSK